MNFFSYLASYFDFDLKNLPYCLGLSIDIFILYPLLAYFKWQLLRRLGVTLKDRQVIFSNRKNNFNLAHFVAKYGDRILRIADGLSRKLLHIFSGLWHLAFLNLVIKDTQIAWQAAFIKSLIVIALCSLSYSSNKVFGLAGVMYGATSRIRDGVEGRKNFFIAQLAFLNLYVLVFIEYIARNNISNKDNLIFFSFFIFLPLIIGDALGEIIGTIWGRQKIRVWGVGQINRKSVLGTVSVFLGSLIPLLLIVSLNNLPFQWWLLCLSVAITTSIIELIAPRSTDNFFIPVGNALVCLIFAVYFLSL